MYHFFEIAKRWGAFLLIAVLILMMVLIFTSQPIDELTSVFAGNSGAGSFSSKKISWDEYGIHERSCKSWAREKGFGAQNSYIIDYCIRSRLKRYYVIPMIGNRLGIDETSKTVKEKLYDAAKDAHKGQESVDLEDRLSVDSLYRSELGRLPIDLRVREGTLQNVSQLLNHPFLSPASDKDIEQFSQGIFIDLKIIAYDGKKIIRELEKSVRLSESEIQEAYQKEQKAASSSSKPSLPSNSAQKKSSDSSPNNTRLSSQDRKRIESSLKTEKATLEKSIMESRLKALTKKGDVELSKISALIPKPIVTLGRVSLSDLRKLKVGSETLNLMQSSFLSQATQSNFSKKTIGPVRQGNLEFYVSIHKIHLPNKKRSVIVKGKENDPNQEKIHQVFLNYLVEEESSRGNFKLTGMDKRKKASSSGASGIP